MYYYWQLSLAILLNAPFEILSWLVLLYLAKTVGVCPGEQQSWLLDVNREEEEEELERGRRKEMKRNS